MGIKWNAACVAFNILYCHACADERVETGACFQWQSQMRYAVNEKTKLSQVWVQLQCSIAH